MPSGAEVLKPKNPRLESGKVTQLFNPSETRTGNEFITHTADTIAEEYRVSNYDSLKAVIRNRVKVTTDNLQREFSRDDNGDIELNEENMNKVRAAVRADLYHLLMPE